MKKLLKVLVVALILFQGCSKKQEGNIEDDKLGFIDADVSSEHTNLREKARATDVMPGTGAKIKRSFENAPPMIPHTTAGFFPIKINRNVCLSCHLPEEAKKVNAVEISKTHMLNVRKYLVEKDGKFENPVEDLNVKQLKKLNNAYFNCSQCHAPQTKIRVDIRNLFTPEFRVKFGIGSSNLKDNMKEGVR